MTLGRTQRYTTISVPQQSESACFRNSRQIQEPVQKQESRNGVVTAAASQEMVSRKAHKIGGLIIACGRGR